MWGDTIKQAVGPGQPNRSHDVLTVQRLLNRNAVFVGMNVAETGSYGGTTEAAILRYQRGHMRMLFATGVVEPNSETLYRLAETRPIRLLAGARGGIIVAPFVGQLELTDDDYTKAADTLQCEVAAIRAVADVETKASPFDKANRPTILFERRVFSRLTSHRFDIRYPLISCTLSGGRYYNFYQFPDPDQWVRLQHAYALDTSAALKSASWGQFQIMGENHQMAGFPTVEEFVRAMCASVSNHLDAFVSYVMAKHQCLAAIRSKDWRAFAEGYNGPSYRDNSYDAKMQKAYEHYIR